MGSMVALISHHLGEAIQGWLFFPHVFYCGEANCFLWWCNSMVAPPKEVGIAQVNYCFSFSFVISFSHWLRQQWEKSSSVAQVNCCFSFLLFFFVLSFFFSTGWLFFSCCSCSSVDYCLNYCFVSNGWWFSSHICRMPYPAK